MYYHYKYIIRHHHINRGGWIFFIASLYLCLALIQRSRLSPMIWYPLGVKYLAIDFGTAVKVSSPGLVDYGISLNTFLIIFALSYFLLQ